MVYFIFLTYLNFIFLNFLFWWLVFLLTNLIFLFLIFQSRVGFFYFIFYFYFQELSGFLMLFMVTFFFISLVIFLKSGLGPFFIWVLPLLSFLKSYYFLVFIFFMKLVYLPVLEKFNLNFFLILFSFFLTSFFFFFLQTGRELVFLSSVEGFNLSFLSSFVLKTDFFFFILFYLLLFYQVSESLEFWEDLEKSFYFFNMPLNLIFLIKVFFLKSIFWQNLSCGLILFSLGLGMSIQFYFMSQTPGFFSTLKKSELSLNYLFLFSFFFFI